ncbi:hypothetical protein [Flaviaesturariibacter amylovorans]|uniref:Uncharacterized protein n=1 Tax=Flaviaesturariibacter amylovorans TaxID=1084520 RepID=A0ABP8HUA3_9BACT
MSTWTALYVATDDTDRVVAAISDLVPGLGVSTGPYPHDLGTFRAFSSEPPTHLAVGRAGPGWTAVPHNSFEVLDEWGISLSRDLATRVIVVQAQSTASSYYFALYEKGEQLREIAICSSDDSDEVNAGAPLPFEGPEPGIETAHGYIFDYDAIEAYCRHFGLELEIDEASPWTTLRHLKLHGPQPLPPVPTAVPTATAGKPWWKFW